MTSTTNDNVDYVKVKRFNQYIGAFVASLGGFTLGVSLGWNSSVSEVLTNSSDATITEIGLVGGILNAGICAGVLSVPFIIKYINRISIMLLAVPIYIVGWTLICCADRKVVLLIIGRLVCGVSGGVFCVLTPIYVAEIADKEIRGRLLTFFQLLINCGIMYAFLMAHILDENETIWRYSIICAITCLTIALVNLLPESPLYYLARNNEIKAEGSLRWYRGENYKIEDEIAELKRLALITRSEKITLKMIRNRRVLRSFLVCYTVILSQQLCGINTMIFYALTIFNNGISGELTGSEQTLIVGAVQILSCLLATTLVHVLGRRILLTISSALMGLFLILLGWFFNLRDVDPEYDDIYWWMPPTWTTLFFASFNIGVGPISWSLLGDIFPVEIKLASAASAASFSWLISLIATLTFVEMIVIFGVPKTMWLFAAFCWIGAVFCAFFVKDTSGKSLMEIQEDFHINYSQSQLNRNPGEGT